MADKAEKTKEMLTAQMGALIEKYVTEMMKYEEVDWNTPDVKRLIDFGIWLEASDGGTLDVYAEMAKGGRHRCS